MANRIFPDLVGRYRLLKISICLMLLMSATLLAACFMVVPSAYADNETDNFTNTATWYRDFAPGIINSSEGTIELTARIDKPYSEFGNDYDFLFRLIPEQSGPGFTLINAHIPPPISKPTGSTYDQPLTFFVKNGEATNGAFAYAQPNQLNYVVGQPFNLAFTWKMGAGGYAAIYKDGVLLTSSPTTVNAVLEKFMPYEFMIERGAPYNITNVKISTRALAANELEHSTSTFTHGVDTALLADATLGQPIQSQKFITPWHTSSQYSVVKPAFRNEKEVFYQNEAAVYPVMTVNYGSTAKTYTVSIKATDPSGNVVFTEPKIITVPADGTYRMEELTLPQLNSQVGFWYLETTVSSTFADPIVYKSGISKVPTNDTTVADGNYATYYGTHSSYSYDISPWKKINTNATRTWDDARVFLWNKIEPTKGHFTWEHADQYVKATTDAGMDVLAVMGYPSNWASTRPPVSEIPTDGYPSSLQYPADRWVSKDIQDQNGVPGNGADWTNYVYQTMKRYAGKVKYYEIVNEVNFHPPYLAAGFSGTKEQYFLMLKIAHEQAQKVKTEYLAETGNNLELYVTTSGFTSVSGTAADRQMTIDALQEPYVGYYDFYNVHGYQGTNYIPDILTAYAQAKITHPNLKLWQGEFFPLGEIYPTMTSKLYGTVQKYMEFLSAGFSKFFTMGVPNADTFVTRFSQSPTEIFQTTAVMQNQIRKADQYLGSYSGFPGENFLTVNHYLHRTDGNYLSILSADSQLLNINVTNSNKIIRVIDNYGNPVSVDSNGKIVKKNTVFVVSSEPLAIGSVTGDVPLTIIRNGDIEKLSGDPIGGPAAVTIDNWGMGAGVYGTNAYVNKTSPYQGVNAVEFNSTGAAGNRTYMYQTFTVTNPGTYALSAFIKKVEGGADVQPELNIWAGNSDHQLAPVTLSSQYAYYAKTYTVTQPLDITVNIGILSGAGKVVFDNVSFDPVPDNVEIVMDNSDATGVTFTGTTNVWDNTRTNSGANKGNFALNTSKEGKSSVIYTPFIPLAGMYDVYEWHHSTTGTTDAPFTINHGAGSTIVKVNQSTNGNKWNKIGSFPFNMGSTGSVVLTNGFTSGNFMLADGIKFVRTGSLPPVFANGNFESKSGDSLGGPSSVTFDNWSMGSGVYGTNAYVNTNNPYQGGAAAEFNSAGVPGGRTDLIQKFTVLQPGTYSLSAYIKKLSGGSDVQAELNVWDGVSDHQMVPIALTDQYAYYANTFVVTQPMEITIKTGILSGLGKVLFDNVSFDLIPDNVEIAMDNSDATGVKFTGSTWDNTRINTGANKGDFALNASKNGNASAIYTPLIPISGIYDVYEWHHSTAGTTDAPFTINGAAGSTVVKVNQSINGGKWNKIGSSPFLAGSSGSVVITNGFTTSNFILADGIKFVRIGANVPVQSIMVTGNPSAVVLKGAALPMIAAILPVNATNKAVVWSVVDGTGKAVIDSATGILTGVETGMVTVNAAAADGSGVKGQLQVNVITLDHVTLTASKPIMKSGDQSTLTVIGIMSNGSQADLSTASLNFSSDRAIATVDAQGIVTATASGEGTVHVKATATLGGTSAEASVAILVDNTKPTTVATVSPSAPNGSNGWYTRDVIITLNAEDNLSGINKTEYRIGESGDWIAYTAPFTLGNEGVNEVQYRSIDQAGNVEEQHTINVQIDKTPPADAILTPDITTPTNTNVTLTITYPADAVVKEYKMGESGTWTAYMNPVVVSVNASVYARGKDAAGNLSKIIGYAVGNIDNVIPTATVVYSSTTPTTQNVVATLIPSKPITITNNVYSSNYTFYFNGNFTFEFVDAVGNKGTLTAVVNNIVSKSKAKPGKPVLTNNNGYDTGINDGTYNVMMNLWYGENGRLYKLYENDVLIDTQILSDNTPNAQTAVTAISGKANGTYHYYVELTNAYGTTRSDVLTVTVTQAAPAVPVLSNDNWDGDGNYKVTMNLWWGTNGRTYRLYENNVLIDTQTIADHSPSAQSTVTNITNKGAGVYVYYAELVNYAGITSSEKMMVNVTARQ
ncbi:hypothetical protein GC102_06050 [Paenibacillus sp. LMG 31460]|uniref:BIG2 domain-containing protein n=1 Tax=Paenibacillus germinis TaxID=2654979 RepID=A0ABX1YW58_9BACL|nr:Ig-like domain-containing protein [Paenibacillus germinis]NOU85345.1 hypothetical protein [Paenibacillus germinis]